MSSSPSPQTLCAFVDLDGTIMMPGDRIPARSAAAIRAAREAGHRVVLATGRARPQIPAHVLDLGFDVLITGSGWRIELADGERVYDGALTTETVAEVVRLLDDLGVTFYAETHEGLSVHPAHRGRMEELLFADLDPRERAEQSAAVTEIPAGASPLSVTKFFFLDTDLDLAPLLPATLTTIPPSIPELPERCGEIVPVDVHKATALQLTLDHLGVDRARSVAIGDGHNDIEMLRHARTGIAMGGACEHVRAAADLVTAPVEEDGLAAAFAMAGLLTDGQVVAS